MDSGSLQHQIFVSLDDLDQSNVEVQELKARLKNAGKFIQTLKNQINKSREKRKDLCDQIKKDERKTMGDHLNQALKDITKECENLYRDNATLKHEMEFMAMKLTKEFEEKMRMKKIFLSP